MRTSITKMLLLCLSFCFLLGGCGSDSEETKTATLTSADGKYQITLPEGWSASEELNDDYFVLETQGPTEDQYVGIMLIPSSQLGDMDLATYMDSYAEEASEQFTNAAVGTKEQTTVAGENAYKMQISGKLEDQDYMNWIYVVDAGESLYVATGSCYPDNQTSCAADFDAIVQSFTEITTTEETK